MGFFTFLSLSRRIYFGKLGDVRLASGLVLSGHMSRFLRDTRRSFQLAYF